MSSKDKAPISSLLNRPHFEGSTSNAIPSDPVIPTRIVVTLDQIVAYTDNPRQTRNPMYDEIKESIRNRGLDHAPNVTRKNPTDPYMIKDGGNTRLQILRELFDETGDEKFYRLDVMFHPWKNQLDMLIGHAVENEMRGNMIFIERALHAKKIKHEMEAADGKNLSIRELAKRISAEGWSLDQTSLNHLLYAEENLLPVMSEALWSGIGIDRVKKIRKLLDVCRIYWEAVSTPDEGVFDEIWKPVFSTLDGDGFDVFKAEYELCGAMAQRLDGPIMSVTAQIQGLLEGMKGLELMRPKHFVPEPKVPLAPKPPKAPRNQESANTVGSSTQAPEQLATQPVTHGTENFTQTPPTAFFNTAAQRWDVTTQGEVGGLPSPDLSSGNSFQDDYRLPISEISGGSPVLYRGHPGHTTFGLQERAFEIAEQYANRYGLIGSVVCTLDNRDAHDAHMGFVLKGGEDFYRLRY
jgi:ParB family protein of integrating conjugative element (PFGI_1 class)